jgi:hypothetical protein
MGYINLTGNEYKLWAVVNTILNFGLYIEGEEFHGYLSDY